MRVTCGLPLHREGEIRSKTRDAATYLNIYQGQTHLDATFAQDMSISGMLGVSSSGYYVMSILNHL